MAKQSKSRKKKSATIDAQASATESSSERADAPATSLAELAAKARRNVSADDWNEASARRAAQKAEAPRSRKTPHSLLAELGDLKKRLAAIELLVEELRKKID